ncbi:MAG: CotH kinase family protein [Bacteroidetes bacterium]|nr:CotH kinase family protein [Bacteroidota bacterium]
MGKNIYFLLLTLISFANCNLSFTQVIINEVSSATDKNFLDEDGSAEDWIEFYNTSSNAINMQGFKIIRDENGKVKNWTFPNIYIKAHSYLTLFCSGKDRSDWFDHWEVPVYANDIWKYFIGTSEPPSNWRTITFNDTSWASGKGGIGFGDGDDSTIIPSALSVYMRKSFTIADTSKISIGALLVDYDDAFVAYLNDVEIARSNIGVYGDHPAYNTDAYDEHEAQMYQNGNFSGGYYVMRNIIDSALKPGLNVFSIQTHNYSAGLNDLSCIPYFLIGINDTSIRYYPFPATVHLHSSFNLTNTGQNLTLINSVGNVMDNVSISYMESNHSRGRIPDGSNNWCILNNPTPDSTNNLSVCFSNYASAPTINLPAGFYSSTQQVSISNSGSDLIRYTKDGSVPTAFSPLYTAPITVDSTKIIRARKFSMNGSVLPSSVSTNTYFINDNPTLPVFSLSTDTYNLFDWNYGIYMLGPNADTNTLPFLGANFWQDWSRTAHIEFFDTNDQQAFELNAEIKIQGNFSKAWKQKGFTIKATDDFDGYPFNYPLFPDKPNIIQYNGFNIRNAGSDWNTCHMRDRLNHKTVQKMTHLDIMDGRPCILFVNGLYFGVYELREKQDKYYVASNGNVDKDKIDFLQFNGVVIEGSNKGFLDMVNFIGSNNMALLANYDYAKSMIDLENFVDYFITETYALNIDWLGSYTNNIKYWRSNNPVGKWRYILWDTDLTLGFLTSFDGADTTNMLQRAINPPVSNPHSVLLKSLLGNNEFKNYFVDRYCDLMNTIFRPYNFKKQADDLHDEMLPEMARHFALWGSGGSSLPFPWDQFIGRSTDVFSWEANIDTMEQFMYSRPYYAFNQLQNQFSLTKQVNVGLDVNPAGAGIIKLNTIYPDSLPWSGIYMDGVPITMTAIANNGYKFISWDSPSLIASPDTNSMITINVTKNEPFTAHFIAYSQGINNLETDINFNVFPNPFSKNFTLNYSLPAPEHVLVQLFDLLGKEIAVLVSSDHLQNAGMHHLNFDTEKYAITHGMYFIKISTGGQSQTIKLIKMLD